MGVEADPKEENAVALVLLLLGFPFFLVFLLCPIPR